MSACRRVFMYIGFTYRLTMMYNSFYNQNELTWKKTQNNMLRIVCSDIVWGFGQNTENRRAIFDKCTGHISGRLSNDYYLRFMFS